MTAPPSTKARMDPLTPPRGRKTVAGITNAAHPMAQAKENAHAFSGVIFWVRPVRFVSIDKTHPSFMAPALSFPENRLPQRQADQPAVFVFLFPFPAVFPAPAAYTTQASISGVVAFMG